MFHSKQRPKSFQKSMVEALAFLTQLQFANFLMVVGVAGGPPQPLPIGRAQVGSAESWTAARRRCTASVWVYDADVFHHREAPRLQFDGTRQIVIDVASTDQPPIHIHMQNRVFQGSFRLPGSCSSCVFYSFRSLPGPKTSPASCNRRGSLRSPASGRHLESATTRSAGRRGTSAAPGVVVMGCSHGLLTSLPYTVYPSLVGNIM